MNEINDIDFERDLEQDQLGKMVNNYFNRGDFDGEHNQDLAEQQDI